MENVNDLLETGEFPSKPIEVKIIGGNFIVFNHTYGSLLYGFGRYFGIPVGIKKPKSHIFDKPLELTGFEALFLQKNGIVQVFNAQNEMISTEQLENQMQEIIPHFSEKNTIYDDLRNKKYIVRPGQKFGADFIVYKEGPGVGHSDFCIKVLHSNTEKLTTLDITTAGRLANSVKKKFVLANPRSSNPTYFQFKWKKL